MHRPCRNAEITEACPSDSVFSELGMVYGIIISNLLCWRCPERRKRFSDGSIPFPSEKPLFMRILLLSDTHGDSDRVLKISEKLTGIDLVLHCGDYQHDAFMLEDTLGIPVISVKGNCDGNTREDKEIVETPYGKILLTHGNWESVDFKYDNLLYMAEEKDCFAVCFGHTHVAFAEEIGGIHLINPGSLTEPRDGSGGTYAILRCTEDDFCANIVRYDRIFGNDADSSNRNNGSNNSRSSNSSGKSGAKVKGGFLRNLLNYSDRF